MMKTVTDSTSNQSPTSELSPIIGCVALAERIALSHDALLADFSERVPDAEVAPMGHSEHGSLLFQINGNIAAISLIESQLPWEDMQGPCATAWWWPEAEHSLQRHMAHVVVMLMGEAGTPASRHIDTTHLLCLLARRPEAVGIYWPGGTLVHEPHAFIDQTVGMSEGALPLHLWVDMRVETIAPQTHRFFTVGMSALGQMELEVDRTKADPASLMDLCHSILHYIVVEGVEMQDGETVGRHEDEKIQVRRAPSMFSSRGEVLKLELEG